VTQLAREAGGEKVWRDRHDSLKKDTLIIARPRTVLEFVKGRDSKE